MFYGIQVAADERAERLYERHFGPTSFERKTHKSRERTAGNAHHGAFGFEESGIEGFALGCCRVVVDADTYAAEYPS